MKQGIEKVLDEEIDKWIFDFGHTGGMYISPSKIVLNPHEYLKSFIRETISQREKEIAEEVAVTFAKSPLNKRKDKDADAFYLDVLSIIKH